MSAILKDVLNPSTDYNASTDTVNPVFPPPPVVPPVTTVGYAQTPIGVFSGLDIGTDRYAIVTVDSSGTSLSLLEQVNGIPSIPAGTSLISPKTDFILCAWNHLLHSLFLLDSQHLLYRYDVFNPSPDLQLLSSTPACDPSVYDAVSLSILHRPVTQPMVLYKVKIPNSRYRPTYFQTGFDLRDAALNWIRYGSDCIPHPNPFRSFPTRSRPSANNVLWESMRPALVTDLVNSAHILVGNSPRMLAQSSDGRFYFWQLFSFNSTKWRSPPIPPTSQYFYPLDFLTPTDLSAFTEVHAMPDSDIIPAGAFMGNDYLGRGEPQNPYDLNLLTHIRGDMYKLTFRFTTNPNVLTPILTSIGLYQPSNTRLLSILPVTSAL